MAKRASTWRAPMTVETVALHDGENVIISETSESKPVPRVSVFLPGQAPIIPPLQDDHPDDSDDSDKSEMEDNDGEGATSTDRSPTSATGVGCSTPQEFRLPVYLASTGAFLMELTCNSDQLVFDLAEALLRA